MHMMNLSTFYIEPKLLTLYYLIKENYSDKENTFISYNPLYGIKIITTDENLYKNIKIDIYYYQLYHFTMHEWDVFNFTPYKFYITLNVPLNINSVNIDYNYIYKHFNVNITLISNEMFIIEDCTENIITDILLYLNNRYDFVTFNNTYFFNKK